MPQTVNGLGFMIARNGQVIYAQAFGNQQVDTVLPIASSSKMPSAAVIMSMVDQGLLDLDKPVGSYLAGKIDWPQDKAAITLRMMLNHTSGLQPNAACLVRPFLTLRECAQEIANAPLDFAPGTKFEYGGGGFQVAGYIAEAVSGQRWSDLFDQRIGKPLGLTTFNYGVGTNPQIAGSARSDLADYTKIEQMFLADGVYNSQRILSHAAITEMEQDQVAGVPKLYSPGGNALPGYSFGWWHTDPQAGLAPPLGAFRAGAERPGSLRQRPLDRPRPQLQRLPPDLQQHRDRRSHLERGPPSGGGADREQVDDEGRKMEDEGRSLSSFVLRL